MRVRSGESKGGRVRDKGKEGKMEGKEGTEGRTVENKDA